MFPEFFEPLLKTGVVGAFLRGERGKDLEKVEVRTVYIPEYSGKGYKGVDDSPYGGGAGMVMKPDTLQKALLLGVKEAGHYGEEFREKVHIVCPLPRGKVWNEERAKSLASEIESKTGKDLVFICGRYEGIDERFLELYVDEFISIGEYIVSGGEIPVLSILDSTLRFVKGVLSNTESPLEESYQDGLIEYPHYTKPLVFEEKGVPDVLLSGHHGEIKKYRDSQKIIMTEKYRPDLLRKENK